MILVVLWFYLILQYNFILNSITQTNTEIIRLSLFSLWPKVLQVERSLFWHSGERSLWSSIVRLEPIAFKVKRVSQTLSYVWSKLAGMKSLNANQYLPFIILHIFVWVNEKWRWKKSVVILIGKVFAAVEINYLILDWALKSACCMRHCIKEHNWQHFSHAVEVVEENLENIYPSYYTASN